MSQSILELAIHERQRLLKKLQSIDFLIDEYSTTKNDPLKTIAYNELFILLNELMTNEPIRLFKIQQCIREKGYYAIASRIRKVLRENSLIFEKQGKFGWVRVKKL